METRNSRLESRDLDQLDQFIEKNQLEIANLNDSAKRSLTQRLSKEFMTDPHIKLKDFEQRYKCLSEASFEAILIHANGKVIDVNQQFLDLHGYTLEELQKLTPMELIAPQYRHIVKEKLDSDFQNAYEVLGLRKDGSTFPLEIRAKTGMMHGRPIRIAVSRDLTEQKKLQRQLANSERKYRQLYENAPVALFRARISDGKIIMCNTALASMIGFDNVEECLQAGFMTKDSYVNPDRQQQFIDQLKKEGKVKKFQAEVRRRDGYLIWISITAELFDEQNYLEGMVTDITASKNLTPTEKRVLKHLMQGKSNKQIARDLDRSVRTIEDHRSNIMQKLGANSIVDLIQIVLKQEIFESNK